MRQGDYVSPEVLEEFVGSDEHRPRSGLGVLPVPTGAEGLLEDAVAHDEDSTQRVEREVLARASARTLKELATPDRGGGDEGTSRFDGSTKRFDADALAAASRSHRPQGLLVGLLVGGVVLAGAAVVLILLASGPEAPPPTRPSPDPPPVIDPVIEDPPLSVDPAASPEGEQAFAQQLQRAAQLQEAEDYQGALQVLATLAPKLRVAHTQQVKALEAQLRAAAAFRREADRALEFVTGLSPEAQRGVGLEQLRAALSEQPGDAARATAARLQVRIAELEAPLPEPGPEARDPDAEPPERAAYFAKLADQGQSVVAALRERIDEEKRERDSRSGAAVEVARARTERKPVRVTLPSGLRVEGTIVEMDERGMTVADGADRIPVVWEALSSKQAYTLRRLAVRDDNAEDYLKFGVWCLTQRQFEEAREAFREAGKLDRGIRARIPPVSRIEAESQVFGGRLSRRGARISVDYRFSASEETRDWQGEAGVRLRLKDGQLQVSGEGMFLAGLKEVGFEDQVELEVELDDLSAGSQFLCGVMFAPGTPDQKAYLVGLSGRRQPTLLVRKNDRLRQLAESNTPIRGDSFKILIRDNRLRVRAGSKDLINQRVSPVWDGVRVVVGGLAKRKSDAGTAAYDKVVVKGKVRVDWLRKAFGALDDLLQGSLTALDELPVFRRPRGTLAEPDLSAEDAFGLRGASPEAREAYARGRAAWAEGTPESLAQANQAFDEAIQLSPGFAAALYRRGLARERLGRYRLALADAQDAIAACPHFYEAQTLLCRLLRAQGRHDEALAAANAALEQRPDFADARLARGATRFVRGELAEALDDLELAVALNPWDDDARRLRQNVATVLAGPPWGSRRFSATSSHFVVETDSSHDRAEVYLEQLEAVHQHYAQLFGVDREAPAAPSKVLIFDTREGFLSYAALTTSDRVESLLGCYLPRYRQLLLYEDKNSTAEETLRVLFHEGFHQFIDPIVPELPFWLNEGLAEYFSTLQVGKAGVEGAGADLPSRSRDLQRFLAQGGPVPFPRLMNQTPNEFYSGPVSFKYAQAWSMVRFFLSGQAPPELRRRFVSYLTDLRGGASPRRAFQEAWDGTDWKAVEDAWRASLR
ncbi:MAG: hypothetical protein KDD82_29045 [Planctomycetes bacterium]|nr:hypothetical protein [Planctomycetota bacterium]